MNLLILADSITFTLKNLKDSRPRFLLRKAGMEQPTRWLPIAIHLRLFFLGGEGGGVGECGRREGLCCYLFDTFH